LECGREDGPVQKGFEEIGGIREAGVGTLQGYNPSDSSFWNEGAVVSRILTKESLRRNHCSISNRRDRTKKALTSIGQIKSWGLTLWERVKVHKKKDED